ncbi:MAG: transposase [Candidatus Binatia bacterium]
MAPGGMVFHVLNRGNQRAPLFEQPADYDAFERIAGRTLAHVPMRVLAYCLMPTHWHFVLWPQRDGELQAFMHRLTTTHARRRHIYRHTVGQGHLYQGTFKSFPVETDEHLLTVCRYVERNPARAGLVARAEHWPWSSTRLRMEGHRAPSPVALAQWPIPVPADWTQFVNMPLSGSDLEACRLAVTRGRPFGRVSWQLRTAQQLGLAATLRPRGRPRRHPCGI